MRYKRLIILSFVWLISSFVWAEAPKFQSPTDDSNTKGSDGEVTSEFNLDSQQGRIHKGIDIWNGLNWPIKAALDGTVEFAGDRGDGYGSQVVIDHGNGWSTRYGHLSEISVDVNKQVKAGDIIGKEGNSGRTRGKTGIHLHFEIRKDGVPVNPRDYIKDLPKSGKGKKNSPGKDHPDESYDISDETFPEVDVENKSPMSNKIQVGIFNEGFSNAASRFVMDMSFCPISLFEASIEDLDNLIHDLKYFPVLIVPSAGFFGLDTSDIVKYKLREYVSQGGVLISFTQQHGYEFGCLPGGEVKGYGWQEDQSCWTNAAYVDTYKPCFAGQSSANLDVNVDGYFTQLPASATVLLRRTKNQMPCMIVYPYGKGYVIASTLYSDWGYGHNHTSKAEIKLIRDLISWAKDMNKDVPEFKPSNPISLNVTITNNTNNHANKVILTLIDPDRNIISTQTITTSIAPYSTTKITYSPLTPIHSSLGIWWVDYELQDNAGNIIQEQTEGERFAVSEHLMGSTKLDGYKIWAISPEYISSGDIATFTVFVRNDTDEDFEGNIGVGVHEEKARGGRWWAYVGTITDVSIPAHSQGSFTFTMQMNISASTYFGLFPKGSRHDTYFMAGAIANCEKGVWIVNPSIKTMIISNNNWNPGDTLSGTITMNNSSPIEATITLTAIIKELGVSKDLSVRLNPNSTTAFPINIPIPATATSGTYTLTITMNNNLLALEVFRIFEAKVWIQGQDYTADDGIQIYMKNLGPIEKSLGYEIRLMDRNNVCVNSNKGMMSLDGGKQG